MEREPIDTTLTELGTVSTDTLGQPIVAEPEPSGYRFLGLLEA